VGASLKTLHYPYGEVLLGISLLATLVFVVIGLADVARSHRLTGIEKLMWFATFIFVSGIAGFVYYMRFRKNFLHREKPGLRY
jgi:hypothetical protein